MCWRTTAPARPSPARTNLLTTQEVLEIIPKIPTLAMVYELLIFKKKARKVGPRRKEKAISSDRISFSRIILVLSMAIFFASCVPQRIQYTGPSGRDIYMTYCSRCHGEDGKGSPARERKLPDGRADLTALSKRNGGNYPAEQVRAILGGTVDIPAHHGSDPMPVWGDLFDVRRSIDRERASQQLDMLNGYLESIQEP